MAQGFEGGQSPAPGRGGADVGSGPEAAGLIAAPGGLEGDGGGPQHRPFFGGGERAGGGAEPGARRRDGCWAHVVDEDLHEDNVAGLFAWHVTLPSEAVDHLLLFNVPLAIPDYIRWEDNNGLLAPRDERTGGYHLRFNHECLAIFNSVASDERWTAPLPRKRGASASPGGRP